ncbi:hypothetical protein MMF93_05035 [Streptomyces tubbatahanensis]|uniref:Uncharacterized protein n=1 Tax=Streptomyces tubbatahanensis TaxID=2923272 RepID=A0ABY3XND9_9ACTN|nr:hypothetical protein [Streptomyces tubbatahanensis]UNS95930.1 hypothetical protein MMF93_05035 [Streptomyces tubbatahanensis]
MSSGHKTVTGFCTVLLGLVLVIAGLALRWPAWAWGTAAVAFVSACLAMRRWAVPPVDPLAQEFTAEPDRPTDPPERREETVTDVVLPSAAQDYDFRFSATIRWWPEEQPKNSAPFSPAGVAVSAVLDRAREVTEQWQPHRGSVAQHRLSGELAVMRADPEGRVLAMAENVTLTLSEADAVRLRKLAAVRKDETLWAHERRYERDRRECLGNDVLHDTGSAVVWWLTKNDEQIRKTVDDLGVLAQLTSAANNEEVPERYAHLVPHPTGVPEGPAPAANGCLNGRHDGDPAGHVNGHGHVGEHGHGHFAGSVPGGAPPFGAPLEAGFETNEDVAPSPVEVFTDLLAAMEVRAGDPDAGVLARALHEGAAKIAREGASEAIRQRFDPAAQEPAPPGTPTSSSTQGTPGTQGAPDTPSTPGTPATPGGVDDDTLDAPEF